MRVLGLKVLSRFARRGLCSEDMGQAGLVDVYMGMLSQFLWEDPESVHYMIRLLTAMATSAASNKVGRPPLEMDR